MAITDTLWLNFADSDANNYVIHMNLYINK